MTFTQVHHPTAVTAALGFLDDCPFLGLGFPPQHSGVTQELPGNVHISHRRGKACLRENELDPASPRDDTGAARPAAAATPLSGTPQFNH